MKRKADFVTNSSSTSYIVCVSDKYTITKNDIENHIWDYEIQYEGDYIEDFHDSDEFIGITIEKLNKMLHSLRMGQELNTYDNDYELWRLLADLLNDTNFVVAAIDSSPDDNRIIGIPIVKLKAIINETES